MPTQISFSNITNPLEAGLKSAGKGLLSVLNPKIPVQNGQPTNAIGDLAKIAGPVKPIPAVASVGQKALSPSDNLKPPTTTLPAQFKAKTTGSQSGDLSKGLISSAPLQSSTQGGTSASLTGTNPATGEPYGNLGTTQTSNPQQAIQQTPQNNAQQNVQDTSYGGLISQLANRGQSDSPEVVAARKALLDSQQKESKTLNANRGVDMNSGLAQDSRERALYGNEQTNLSNVLNSAVNTQGQQIGALNNAASLTQPVGQFGVLTNPVTGQPVNGQSAATTAQQGGYIQGLQSGAQAQGAVSGTTNAANAAQAGTQAFGVNLALGQMSSLRPLITNFLAQTGVNPSDAQVYNSPINNYLGQIQASGQIAQWHTLMSELNRYSSQLIGTGSLTPTGVTAATQLQDPSNLSLAQIDSVLQTLSDAGNNQVYNLQQQAQNAAPGNSIYTGAPANPVSSTKPAPVASAGTPGGGITNPMGQFAVGGGMQLGGTIWDSLKNLEGELIGWLAKGAAAP